MSDMTAHRSDLALERVRTARSVASLPDPLRPGLEIDDGRDVRRILIGIWRRRLLVLLITSSVIVPAGIVTYLSERLYRSSTLIEVSPEPVRVMPYQSVSVPSTPGNLPYMTSQEQILQGPGLRVRVAERLKHLGRADAAREAERLAPHLTVAQIPNSQVFRISYMASSPALAAEVANLFAEEYIDLRFENEQRTRTRARDMLKRELASLEERVQTSEQELVDYAQQNHLPPTDGTQGDLADQKLAMLSRQLIEVEADAVAARAKAHTVESATADNLPNNLVTAVLGERTAKKLALEHELTALQTNFGNNWPEVVQKREELAVVKQQIERETRNVLTQATEQARQDLRTAETRRQLVAAQAAAQEQLVSNLQRASIQYNIFRRDVESSRKAYDGLLERLKETGIASGMEFDNVQIVESATPNPQVASPNALWNLTLATIFGLTLSITFAVGVDFWRDAVSTMEEVEAAVPVPVFAPIPLIRSAKATRRAQRETPQALLEETSAPLLDDAPGVLSARPEGSEAIRALCASLLLSRSDRPPRIIVVTSATAGEGKTTIASDLGRGLAETGARVLLVDCDMRRPGLARHFGLPLDAGLSLYLTGHLAKPTVYEMRARPLFVVTGGPPPPNPPALLSANRLDTFLDEMAAAFTFVIIDTPPVLPIADARILAAKADGVLLVVRAGSVSRRVLRRAHALLESAGATIVGTVLNATERAAMDTASYRYYDAHDASA